MQCPQCRLVEMLVHKVDTVEKMVYWQCRKCGNETTTELKEKSEE